MQQTVRTTIRIQKDLLNTSKLLALRRNTTMQDVVNQALRLGITRIADMKSRKELMRSIDEIRESLKGKNINVQKLIEDSKRELQERTDRLFSRNK